MAAPSSTLRRDLGPFQVYAAMIGILVGAGIFRVTGDAYALTGPSVVLGYAVLAPAVLATSVAYVVFLSTPLGRQPGAEYTHLARTFGWRGLAFVGAWLKVVSYVGACALLAVVLADHLLQLDALLGGHLAPVIGVDGGRPLALGCLFAFFLVHVLGVRWFGRVQVTMCAILGVAIVVLVVPGLFAIRRANYQPFFLDGGSGFLAALPALFFAYAGFESLAHTAGEVQDSTRLLPRVFVRGVLLTALIFVAMSAVALGVLPGSEIVGHPAPLVAASETYLPLGATAFVTVGAVMAVATSLNASFLVPSRIAWTLTHDGVLPGVFGRIDPRTRTPVLGLVATFVLSAVLILGGWVSVALSVAVLALVSLYGLHSLALLALPWRDPELFASATARVPLGVQRVAGVVSVVSMGLLVGAQVVQDWAVIESVPLTRILERGPTSLELLVVWSAVGALLYGLRPRRRAPLVSRLDRE